MASRAEGKKTGKEHRKKGIGEFHGQKKQVWKLKLIGCIFFVFLSTDI